MILIVLLLTAFASLADICAASPRTSASPRTAASSTTTSSSGSEALSGIISALAPVAPYVPIPLLLPEVPTAVTPMIEPSLATAAPPTARTAHEIATSAQTASSRRTATSRRTSPSRRTVSSTTRRSAESLRGNKTTASSSTTSSTTTTKPPITGSSTKVTRKSMFLPFNITRRFPRTTISSPKTTRLTMRKATPRTISWKPTKLQKFAEMLEKECDFDLLDAISEDLKKLWNETMKETEEPISSEMSDMRTLLTKIIDLYNECSKKGLDFDSERQWEIYLKIFGKVYEAKEKEMRKEIFEKNKEEVKEHNELYKKGRVTHRANLNHLSDRTEKELKKMNGLRASAATVHDIPKRKPRFLDESPIWRYHKYNPNTSMPASFDWRGKTSYITPVTSQGNCAACYAFAGIGALEAYHRKHAGELVRLSTQNILDCTWHLGNIGCEDGTTFSVFRYAESVGVVSNSHYPYTMNASQNCQWRYEHVVARDNGYYVVEYDNELALQSAVATHLPVAAGIGTRRLSRYHSGIFATEDCGTIDHAVLVVGYGTDPEHGDYWIAKNCWGFWWGEDGYVRIARNRNNMCKIASYAFFPF